MIFGGLPAFIAYWAGSILFDTYHAIGNVVFTLLLYKPISLALKHFLRINMTLKIYTKVGDQGKTKQVAVRWSQI